MITRIRNQMTERRTARKRPQPTQRFWFSCSFMKTRLMLCVLISPGILACATPQMDSVTIFHIQGRILDQASNFPLQDVIVYFIDTGYDDILSKQQRPFKIAQSDARGKIAARFNYWWGKKTSVFDNRPKATFDIVLSRQAYAEKRFHFKESELQTDRVAFLVDLKDVYMVRENE